MEDLTSPQFARAVVLSGGVAIIPLGIIEKHGPHLPLGTDLYEAREIAFNAARQEYAVVFPPYYTGQIFEAKHQPGADKENAAEIKSLKKAKNDGHAGEEGTSMMYFINPELVDMKALSAESGADQNRLADLPFGYTGIWWYAKYPNHFAGDYNQPDKRLGELLIKSESGQLAELTKYLKHNNSVEQLQNEFYKKSQNPVQK